MLGSGCCFCLQVGSEEAFLSFWRKDARQPTGVRGVGVLCSGHQKVSKEVQYQSHLCEQLQETDCEIFRPHRPQKSQQLLDFCLRAARAEHLHGAERR